MNRLTCVLNYNATIIDQTFTKFFDRKIETRILKVDISSHFHNFFTSKSINIKTSKNPVFVTGINPFTLSLFKEK